MWWREAKRTCLGERRRLEELPSLDLVDDDSLSDLLSRRRWDLRDFYERSGWGEPSYEMNIVPHLRGEEEVPDEDRPLFYDPSLSVLNHDTPWRPLPDLKEDSPFSPDNPWEEDEGSIYRGMSDEELLAALEAGFIESTGGHNIGEAQRGLTYFSSDPRQAASYAGTFAPYNWLPSFRHPGFVVRIPRPEDVEIHPRFPTEIGVRGRVPMDHPSILRLQPYGIRAGRIELSPVWDRREGRKRYTSGTRISPSIYLGFAEQDPDALISEFSH